MNQLFSIASIDVTQVGFGVRILLISAEGKSGATARRLAGLGNQLDCHDELYSGLEAVIEDPLFYGLIVVDCDGVGGLAAGQRAFAMLEVTQRCIPVILISTEAQAQNFPASRYEPTVLRAPVSAVSMRVGFEHALRERLLAQAC